MIVWDRWPAGAYDRFAGRPELARLRHDPVEIFARVDRARLLEVLDEMSRAWVMTDEADRRLHERCLSKGKDSPGWATRHEERDDFARKFTRLEGDLCRKLEKVIGPHPFYLRIAGDIAAIVRALT